MRKIERELRLKFPDATIELTKRHLRLRLPNGRTVTVSATPSDWRAWRNTEAEVKRQRTAAPYRAGQGLSS